MGDELGGMLQIAGHVVGGVGLGLLMDDLSQAPAGADQHGGAPHSLTGGHIGERIADVVALVKSKVVLAHSLQEEAGLWLAAPTVIFRTVRTHVHACDAAPMAGHKRAHPPV
jgi:hypothetical protein